MIERGTQAAGTRVLESANVVFVPLTLGLLAVGARALTWGTVPVRAGLVEVETMQGTGLVLTDRQGEPLAWSEQRFQLVASPYELWRFHTPSTIAHALHEALDPFLPEDVAPHVLLARMLPLGRPAGAALDLPADWLVAEGPLLGQLTEEQAAAFQAGLEGASPRWPISLFQDEDGRPLSVEGMALVQSGAAWRLVWQPHTLLDEEARLAWREHIDEEFEPDGSASASQVSPFQYTRALLGALAKVAGYLRAGDSLSMGQGVVDLDRLPHSLRARFERTVERRGSGSQVEVEVLYDLLWEELMPSRHSIVLDGLPPEGADAFQRMASEQGLRGHQLEMMGRTVRLHPDSQGGRADLPPGAARAIDGVEPTPIPILGHVGVLTPSAAERQAHYELDHHPDRLDWGEDGDPLVGRIQDLVSVPQARSGLEQWALDQLRMAGHDGSSSWSTYWRSLFVPRDRREGWRGHRSSVEGPFERGAHGALVDVEQVEQPWELRTSLDASLQLYAHRLLETTVADYEAALAMGVVVDVETGSVLALAEHGAYPQAGFLAYEHLFEPGSIFKPLAMAIALDAGVDRAGEVFELNGVDGITISAEGSRRRIREAKGAPIGEVSLEQGLYRSLNGVMASLLVRVAPHVVQQRLAGFGFGSPAGGGLFGERVGQVAPSGYHRRLVQTQASLAFGHEVHVNLLQMARGLNTLLRGGRPVDLRFVEGWQAPASLGQAGDVRSAEGPDTWRPLPVHEGEPVVGAEAVARTLDMMRKGATYRNPDDASDRGTGFETYTTYLADAVEAGVLRDVLSKTGTAEKVPGSPCLHLEIQHSVAHAEAGTPRGACCAPAARGERPHKRSCYTSSMCLSAVGPEGRRLMVLVVVEEPRGTGTYGHFGSKVAGPAAANLLRVACGLSPLHAFPTGAGDKTELRPLLTHSDPADRQIPSVPGRAVSPAFDSTLPPARPLEASSPR